MKVELISLFSVAPIQTVRDELPTCLCSVVKRHCRDMPPSGGFESIKYKRNLPFRGPGGVVILAGVTAIVTYGFYQLGKGNIEKR